MKIDVSFKISFLIALFHFDLSLIFIVNIYLVNLALYLKC